MMNIRYMSKIFDKIDFRALILTLVYLLTGTLGVRGQSYSGIYYIANNSGYSVTTSASNWYMVPAKDPQKEHYADAYFNNQYCNVGGKGDYTGDNYGDPEQPFMTTYKTNKDNNSIWIVAPSGQDGYYHIIHAITGKYVVYEPPYKDAPQRKSMHLLTTSTPGENAMFAVTISGSGYNFHPKSVASGNRFFNPAGDNAAKYCGNGGDYFQNGMIGLWSANDGNSIWYIEDAKLLAPTISINEETETFTFSYPNGILPTGYSFLYTTNGDNPTVGGSGVVTWDGTPQHIESNLTLKVVIARYGVVLSDVASQIVGTPDQPTIIASSGCSNMLTITAKNTLATIYYTTNGSTPTPSTATLYTGPFRLDESCTIKAIANLGRSSEVTSYPYEAATAMPVINVHGKTVTISGAGKIYYTTNGDAPTESSTLYEGPFSLSSGTGTVTIKAIAKRDGYSTSCTTEKEAKLGTFIGSLDELLSNLDGDLILTNDIDATGYNPGTAVFTGTLDGGYYTISNLTNPLFATINGGTVKNVVLKNVSISQDGNVGAICNTATGAAKIYNCGVLSGIVGGGTNVGGLVGLIEVESSVRVVNCYNYANVSGSGNAAGIVGKNEGTVGAVRIAMCMMYGNVTGASVISPVYTGCHTSNSQDFTEYNYWRSKSGMHYTAYNDQLAIDKDEYLTRYPFYRHILNTHRELAAYFLFAGNSATDDVNATILAKSGEIGHWVLKNGDGSPLYPVIEEWENDTKRITVDLRNNVPGTSEKYAGKLLTEMGSGGYLLVNINIDGHIYSTQLPITDMDTLRYDYTYGKVVLPFANEFEVNTDYTKVCTGWKITSVSGGTTGTFKNYNMADRDCTAKDLFSNSGYIFAQGGNYVVPYGVTAINIEAHFAKAFYLSDPSYEMGYDNNFANATAKGGSVSETYHGEPVYTSLSDLVADLSLATNPHDQAIVLVGNFHYNIKTLGGSILDTGKAITIMSTDEDCNQEPDYGWYTCNTTGRLEVPPLRFDFVPNIEMGMSSRVGTSMYPGIGIWHARGWFELTETCVSIMLQCEINSDNFTNADNGKGNNRWIANSGYFVQIVRARDGNCNKLSYIQIGGNAYVKEFYPGCHTDNARTNVAVPIAVNGGQVDECYMTGYRAGGKLTGDMLYFWCTGGKIGKFLGAYLEEPTAAGLTAKIDHALIGRFFGGGTSASARIKGDINVAINNSKVDFYCGGPEFGDMESGKKVITHATGTTFGEFYGAGFGGTSITYNREEQQSSYTINNNASVNFPISFNRYTDYRLKKSLGDGINHTAKEATTPSSEYGIGTCYKFESIFHSNGTNGVARFYTGYAQFSLATTGSVTNELNGCTVLGDFYGAGCQGKVNGTVSSTLTNCIIKGSAYGGGYKAESNKVKVYPTTQPDYSTYTRETGIFSDFGTIEPDTFYWQQGDADHDEVAGEGTTLYTSKDITMSELGNVTGFITLIVDGGTVGGSVFGGGNESKSLDNAAVTIKGDASVAKSVYGGGNLADVLGNADVAITDNSTVLGNVYGGGNVGSIGDFEYADVAYHTAHPEVREGKPYECAPGTGKTTVSINGDAEIGPNNMKMTAAGHPDDYGMVYGAGRGMVGDTTTVEYADLPFKAYVNESEVTIDGRAFVKGSVYGGSENGHVLTNTLVKIKGNCQIGNGDGVNRRYTDDEWEGENPNDFAECSHWPYTGTHAVHDIYADQYDSSLDIYRKYANGSVSATDGHTFYGNVFGGGSGYYPYAPGMWLRSAGLVEGNTRVEITGGHILSSVYGGNEMTDVYGSCTVTMSNGTLGVPRTVDAMIAHPVTCNLFGAGKGDERTAFNTWTNVASTSVTVSGTARIFGSVFGGGEDGHVLGNAVTTITPAETKVGDRYYPYIGTTGTSAVDGNIFGGGRGFAENALTAGVVCGNVTLNIGGGTMLGSVFGGGRLASVGTHLAPPEHKNYGVMIPDGKEQVVGGDDVVAAEKTHGNITVTITGGTIGCRDASGDLMASDFTLGEVFAGCKGSVFYDEHAQQLGLAKNTTLSVSQASEDVPTIIHNSIYGGGEAGNVLGAVSVSVNGGIIHNDVYGGGALADTNMDSGNTSVQLHGGVVGRNVYGGGLGTPDVAAVAAKPSVGVEGEPSYEPAVEAVAAVEGIKAMVGGNVLVELNGATTDNGDGTISYLDSCVVKGDIFGCNNLNGTPKGTVTVRVYKTVGWDGHNRTGYDAETEEQRITMLDAVGDENHHYEVNAVYGGGNQSAYEPIDLVDGTTHVVIYGCDQTSIRQVYGGGNAASTPATLVDIYGTYEIEEVFGGGNGKDRIIIYGVEQDNHGANVGFRDYSTVEHIYDTKEKRQADDFVSTYIYGSGKARVNVHGGKVHRVYGGSNTKGNVRIVSVTMLEETSGCPFDVDEAYGGGKSAPMDGESQLSIACIPGLNTVYGGAEDANIEGNVVLNITNGNFDRVFGGNNVNGEIKGTITVNVEETGCRPVIIGQLYGGGNQAPYAAPDGEHGPTLNVRSFTSIGEIYGGGYGATAVVTGDTYVNINVCDGKYVSNATTSSDRVGNRTINFTEYVRTSDGDFVIEDGVRQTANRSVIVYLPPHEADKIGAINHVYGGGNAAKVVGNTNVIIGTTSSVIFQTPRTKLVDEEVVLTTDSERTHMAKGADIRGNVFGGGNNADVTGSTNVVIGQ